MDRININNLFPSNTNNGQNTPLDVNTLYTKNNKNINKTQKFSIDNLLSRKEERKQKTRDNYRRIYNIVLNKITNVNKINDTTELIYNVPDAVFGCKDYIDAECLEYIEYKLRNIYYMDTLKLSNKSIFISWKNIDENRKNIKNLTIESDSNKK